MPLFNRNHIIYGLAGIILLLVCACQIGNVITPLSTPTPEQTITGTAFPTPSRTATRTPASTRTLTPTPLVYQIDFEREITSSSGYISVIAPPGSYIYDQNLDLVISNLTLMVAFFDTIDPDDIEDLEYHSLRDVALMFIEGNLTEDLVIDPSFPVVVDGVEGTAFNFSAIEDGHSVQGQIVLLERQRQEYLVIVGNSFLDEDENYWELEDQEYFQAILDSVHFNLETICTLSSDPAYGYSVENAIAVGGLRYSDFSLIENFLSLLRGPNGEMLTYHYTSGIPVDEVTYWQFEVTYDGISEPIVLFFDTSAFDNPQAPQGFTCGADVFEFGQP